MIKYVCLEGYDGGSKQSDGPCVSATVCGGAGDCGCGYLRPDDALSPDVWKIQYAEALCRAGVDEADADGLATQALNQPD